MPKSISFQHSNRRAYNWAAYDAFDRSLAECSGSFHGKLLDLGAGEAPYKKFFLEHARQYIAVDWSATIHDSAADVVADLNRELPFVDCAVDSIVGLSVLEHIRQPRLLVGESFRVLKPGGHFVLQVPWQWGIHEAPHDYYRYSTFGLQAILCEAGFVDVAVKPIAGFFSMIVLKINYFSMRFVCGGKFRRRLLFCLFYPMWWLGQFMARYLDFLDRDWNIEGTGYFVVARKAN